MPLQTQISATSRYTSLSYTHRYALFRYTKPKDASVSTTRSPLCCAEMPEQMIMKLSLERRTSHHRAEAHLRPANWRTGHLFRHDRAPVFHCQPHASPHIPAQCLAGRSVHGKASSGSNSHLSRAECGRQWKGTALSGVFS